MRKYLRASRADRIISKTAEMEVSQTFLAEDSIKLAEVRPAPVAVKRWRLTLGRAVFAALLGVVAFAAVPYGTVDPWWIAFVECAVFTLAILWLIEGLRSGSWFVGEHRLLLPLLAIIVFAIIQTLPVGITTVAGVETRWTISADPFETRLWVFRMGAYALVAALMLRFTSSPRRFQWLIHFVVLLGVACALFGIFRQTMQRGTPGFLLPRLMPGSGYAQFINRNHFPFLMEMTLGLLFGLIVWSSARRERLLLYLSAAVPVWVSLVLSNSRGGILSMLLQLMFAAAMFRTARPPQGSSRSERFAPFEWLNRVSQSIAFRAALIVCLLAAGAFSVVWIGGEQLASRLQSVQEGGGRVRNRRIKLGGDTRGDLACDMGSDQSAPNCGRRFRRLLDGSD